MLSQSSPRDTVYKQFVFSNLFSTVLAGQGAYNYKELAEMVGLKPTHNFRARVRQMAAEGIFKAETVFTQRGGLELRFSIPMNEPQEIPF